MKSSDEFDAAFKALTGHEPFPWQRRLFMEHFSRGTLPMAVDIPTGLGKTAVMAVWLLARASGALPRRLVYVVDRRAVVDQATEFAEQLRAALNQPALAHVRHDLGFGELRGLPISTLRGRYVDNREWLEDPTSPAIIVGTVDMVGSRLLFEGYGVSRRMRPYAAGLMGCDALVMLDEAHLAQPFERLLQTVERERCPPGANGDRPTFGAFSGPAASDTVPPAFRVLPLSATLGHADGKVFRLNCEDRRNAAVSRRLRAEKVLTVERLEKNESLDDALADRAWQLAFGDTGSLASPARVSVFCNGRDTAENVAKHLRRRAKSEKSPAEAILFVGARRVRERDEARGELMKHGLIAGGVSELQVPVFLVATSAGEVGVDLNTDHMVCDLVAWERMVQRLGRVNRYGENSARVAVVDQAPPDGKKTDSRAAARHDAVRKLLKSLPPADNGGHLAGPDALNDAGTRDCIQDASTPIALHPALSRPLVDAWAMTSLVEHAGRPEIGPWLRGWVDDEPQTTVFWRRYLPLRFEGSSGQWRIETPTNREVDGFFDAAPLRVAEALETETRRVIDWLKRRARQLLKTIDAAKLSDDTLDDNEAENKDALAPLTPDAPVAFVLGGSGELECTFSLAELRNREPKALARALSGRQLAVDARLGGIANGLLDTRANGPAVTIEDNWGRPEAWEAPESEEADDDATVAVRLRVAKDDEQASEAAAGNIWRQVHTAPYRVSPEGDVQTWLVVEKRRGANASEDARAMTSRPQALDEHQTWVAREVARIADELRLEKRDRAMLVAAARHHDDGKGAPRWQRAFNAPQTGGPYAKTSGPLNVRLLNGYRHEFQSACDAARNGLDGVDRADPRFELALHLIAAHHGGARPSIGIDGCDGLPPSAAEAEAYEIALRYARLQRQWGPWGLAWWEALLRAADQRASRALDDETPLRGSRTEFGPQPGVLAGQSDLFAAETKGRTHG